MYSGVLPALYPSPEKLKLKLILCRAQDLMLFLAMAYPFLTVILPSSWLTSAGLHFAHALAWMLFHTLGLGVVLKAQSSRKFLVGHFLKHYHYPARDGSRGALREAFASWKAVYNLSMCMSYGVFPTSKGCLLAD